MKRWHKKLWGVVARPPNYRAESILISDLWCPDRYKHAKDNPIEGEPPRILLFMTREQARKWCAEKTDGAAWKYSPVRVVETVRIV